jgi:iron complex outermembrane receptor protein
VQLDGSWLHKNDFRLPSGYLPVTGLQEGDKRHHSGTTDYQFNGKFGFTPKDGDEYIVGVSRIAADKYVPPYLGTNGMPRFWRYKDWDKEQIHFFSKTAIHPDWNFESRLFYDRYYNLLKAYDNKEYNSQEAKSAFNSYYDDYSAGARFILAWNGIQNHTLKLGANYKRDVHRSHDDLDPVAKQDEYTASVALEDTWEASNKLFFLAGAGFFYHKGKKAEMFEPLPGSNTYWIVSYPTSSDQDINYQFAVDYKHNRNHTYRFSLSRNARFASLKDRYSYKRGRAIPNPDLKTERSFNLDITYNGSYKKFRWYASAYYMFLSNTIQEITGMVDNDPLIWQLQNKGKAHYRGLEAGLSYYYKRISAEANYTFINRTNKSDKEVSFLGVPDHKWNVILEVALGGELVLQTNMTALTSSHVSSNGDLSIPGYALFHSNISKTFNHVEVKLGIKNLFDKLYYLSEGYPMEGRLIYASLSYTFNSQ